MADPRGILERLRAEQGPLPAQGAPAAPAPKPRAVLDRLRAEQAPAAPTGRDLMQARADPATYLGGARAPEPTGAERAIGFAGERIGVPALMAGRALPGGELGYQLMRRFAPEHAGAAAGAVEESLAASPTVPKWVPGLGGWQPVRTAMQIAPYIAGGAAGAAGGGIPAGLMTIGAERGAARGVERGMAPLDVAATAATGALEMGAIGGAFQVGGKLTPRGKWWRSLTPTQQAQRVMGLPAGPPPPPRAMQMLSQKVAQVGAPKTAVKAREGYVRAWVAEQAGKGSARATKNAEHRYISALRRLPASQQGTHLQQAKSMAMARILETAPAGAGRGPTEIRFGQALEAGGMWGFESRQIAGLKTQLDAALTEARARGKEPILRKMSRAVWEGLKRQWAKSDEAFRTFWHGDLPADPVARAKVLNMRLQAATAGAQYRTAPAGGTEAEYLSFLAPKTVAKAPAGAGMKLYGGVPADPAEFIRLAQTVGDISQPVAVRILEALGRHGGDVAKAAVAVGVQEGVAKKLAEAVAGRGIEAAPTGPQAKRVQPAPPAPAEAAPAKEPWAYHRTTKDALGGILKEGMTTGDFTTGSAIDFPGDTTIRVKESDIPLPQVGEYGEGVRWLLPGYEKGGPIGSEKIEVQVGRKWIPLADYPDLAPAEKVAPAPTPAPPAPTKAAEVQARKLGIDLAAVKGTGRKGQILHKDVQNAARIRTIKEKSERIGAPLRPGTVLEQTRQALEDEGLPTRAETLPAGRSAGVPQERRTPAGEAEAKEGEIAPARGRPATPQPQKPPITAAGRAPLGQTGAEQPPAGQGEAVPMEVLARGAPRAAPTMQAFARLSPEELVRMLGKISGPYGGTVAETKGVGQAVKALRQAMKNRKVAEAGAGKDLERMQAAYPDALEGAEGVAATPLLDWLKGDKINAWKGLMYATEIAETIAGRPALAKLFVRKQPKVRPPQGYLDQVTDSAVRDPDSGFRGQTVGDFLDQMVAESGKAAARAEGKVSTEEALRRLARAGVPEEAAAELTERADALAQEMSAIDAAREKVLAAAEPYLAVGGEPPGVEVVEVAGTVAERGAVEKLATAEREVAAARQTINQLKILQSKAQEQPAEIEALRKVFVSIVERMLPLEERGKLLARVRTLKTVVQFTHALEQAEKYLEQTIKLRILARYQHYAGLLERHKQEIEPEILAYAKKALAARPVGGRYTELELDTLDELADTVEQTWHWHQTSENLLGLGQYIERTETAEKILAEATAGREPMPRKVGHGGQPIAPDIGKVHWFGREGIQSLDTMIEGPALGAVPDGPLYQHFVSLVGIEASEPYYRHVNAGLDHLDEAIERELGMKRDSLEFQDWVLEPLTFDLPTLGKLTAPRGYWGALRNTLTDPDSLAEMVTEAWSGLVWESDLRMPKLRPTTRDADAFLAQWAEREPQADEVAKAAKQYINRKEHFKALSEKNHEIFGLYFPQSTGQYWGRRRNVRTEGRLDLPAWLSQEDGSLLITQPGRYKPRTGSQASLIIGSFIDQYMSSLYEDAAFLAYGTPGLNAIKLLKAPLERGDRRMTLEAWLQEYHGTSFGNALRDQLRHIMESRRLAPVRYGEGPPTGAARKVLGATRRAVLMSPWPWVSQLPSGAAFAADTLRPVTLGSVLSGMRRSLLSGEFSGLRDLLEGRSATLRWRWHEARAESIIGTQTEAGSISQKKGWRKVQRTVRSILKPLMKFDRRAIVGGFAGAIEDQLAARSIPIRGRLLDVLNGLPGAEREEIIKAAVDHVHWLVPRTQPNLDPAYDSGIKREAKKSLFWMVMTYFTNFRNRMVNMFIRLAHEYRRTGNLKKLLAGLVPLVLITLGYTLKGQTQRAISGGQPRLGGVGGDIVENAIGNLYGAGEIVNALRARSGYAARLRGVPAAQAVTDVLGGFVEMRRMITDGPKVRGPAAWRATKGLVRGTGMMLGLPTPILFSLIRSMGRIGEEPAGEKKADTEALAWKASGEGAGAAAAVEELKAAGITYAEARRALRASLAARGDRSAKAWFERGAALRKMWYAAKAAA